MVSGFKGWGRKITHLHSQARSSIASIPILIDKLRELETCHLTSLSLFPSSVKGGCCCCSVANLCPILCDPTDCSTPGSSVLHYLPDLAQTLMSIESVMPSNRLILCHPHLHLPSIFPSNRVFSNELALCIRWPSIGASALASVLPMYIQGWFPLGLTDLISLLSKGLSSIFSRCSIYTCSMDVQLDWMCN